MKKILLLILLSSIYGKDLFSQYGWTKIYDQQLYGISRALIFPNEGLNYSSIYLQLGLSNAQQNNDAGRVYKLNKSTLQFHSVFNQGLDRTWVFAPMPPTWVVNIQNPFCIPLQDSSFALRNYTSGCGIDCGDRTYYTTNYGSNWTPIPELGNDFLGSQSRGFDIHPSNPNIMYSVYPRIGSNNWQIVYKSTNKGINWSIVDSLQANTINLPAGYTKINPLNTNYIYLKGFSSLYVSTSSGTNFFSAAGSLSFDEIKFNRFDSSIIGYKATSFYKSVDHGVTWQRISSVRGTIRSLAISADNGSTVYAGTTYGLYKSVNGGMNWVLFNDSFSPAKTVIGLNSDAGMGDTVFAVTNDAVYKVWDTYVSTGQISSEIPEKFSLSQNYPNPFNPTTNIHFQIPNAGFVNLLIFDVLGKEVQTLVNEQLSPGTYEVDFDGSSLPSGVYYYKLEAGSFIETKKMVLIK